MTKTDFNDTPRSRLYTVESLSQEKVSEAGWDRLVSGLNGSFIHSFAWSRYMTKESRQRPRYLVIRDGGRAVAADWYVIQGKSLGPAKLLKYFSMETLPCYDPEAISEEDVFRKVYSFAERERCVAFSFGNSAYEPTLFPERSSIKEKITFSIDLRMPVEALTKDLHERHRSRIRKGEKSALEVRCFNADEARSLAGPLQELFAYTFRKHSSIGKESGMMDMDSFLNVMHTSAASGNIMLFAAFFEEEPVSCYISAGFNENAAFLYGASNAKGYELNASYLVIWKMIEHFRNRNYRSLSLGEVPKRAEDPGDLDHGLFRFKYGFSKKTGKVFSGSVVLRPAVFAAVAVIKRLRGAVAGRPAL
jgi:hypothetical protein